MEDFAIMTASQVPKRPSQMHPGTATRPRAYPAAAATLAIILGGFGCESDSAGLARPASLQGVTIHDSARRTAPGGTS